MLRRMAGMQREATLKIINQFGGLRAMAAALGHENPTTVQGWKVRGRIPSQQIPNVIEAAKGKGIEITHADFFSTGEGEAA